MKLGFSAADELFRQECADWLNAEIARTFKQKIKTLFFKNSIF